MKTAIRRIGNKTTLELEGLTYGADQLTEAWLIHNDADRNVSTITRLLRAGWSRDDAFYYGRAAANWNGEEMELP